MKRFVAAIVLSWPLAAIAQPRQPTLEDILNAGQSAVSTTVANFRTTIENQAVVIGQLKESAAGEPQRVKAASDAAVAKQKAEDEKLETKAVADAIAKQKTTTAACPIVPKPPEFVVMPDAGVSR